MRTILFVIMIALVMPGVTLALDLGKKDSETTKIDQDISQAWKRNVELKDSDGRKKSRTWTKGRERQQQHSDKQAGSIGQSGQLDITITPDMFFLRRVQELEEAGVEPFGSCRVVSAPKLPRDFGLSAEIMPGVIDTIKAGYLGNAAASNTPIASVADENAVKAYRDCLAEYGSTIREAYLILQADLAAVGGKMKQTKDGIEVRGLGLEDYQRLVGGAVDKAIQSAKRQRYGYLLTADPCRFAGKPEAIQCGPAVLKLDARPELAGAGVVIYGGQFGGLQGTYKISSHWSLTSSLERLKTVSTFAKFADEVSDYAEHLEANGKTKEAAYARKKALEMAAAADMSLNVAPFIK